MGAIDVRPSRQENRPDVPEEWMPFRTRIHVTDELNKLWAEFVTEMHDGPTYGREVAEKFWQFVTTRGRPA